MKKEFKELKHIKNIESGKTDGYTAVISRLNISEKVYIEELRKELLEFMEANNYFISALQTKKNAIGIVDSYLKNYKGLNDL